VIIGDCREEGLVALVSGSFMAPLASGTRAKSTSEAESARQRTRRGSLTEVSFGGSGVCIMLAAITCRLGVMKFPTSLVCRW